MRSARNKPLKCAHHCRAHLQPGPPSTCRSPRCRTPRPPAGSTHRWAAPRQQPRAAPPGAALPCRARRRPQLQPRPPRARLLARPQVLGSRPRTRRGGRCLGSSLAFCLCCGRRIVVPAGRARAARVAPQPPQSPPPSVLAKAPLPLGGVLWLQRRASRRCHLRLAVGQAPAPLASEAGPARARTALRCVVSRFHGQRCSAASGPQRHAFTRPIPRWQLQAELLYIILGLWRWSVGQNSTYDRLRVPLVRDQSPDP